MSALLNEISLFFGHILQIKIRPPGPKGRLEILKIHASKVKMSESVDLSSYALNLPGMHLSLGFCRLCYLNA